MKNEKPTLNELKGFAYDKIAILERANKELAEVNKMIAEYVEPEPQPVETKEAEPKKTNK